MQSLILALGILSTILSSQTAAEQSAPVRISGGVMAGLALNRAHPVIQPRPDHRVSGTVVVRIVVGTDGKVESAEVISGDEALRPAALDAARQWTFKPYLRDGTPMRVETTLVFMHGYGQNASEERD